MGSVDTLCVGMCVYAFFGITLALSPRDFWGPESPLCYWTEMDASGQWFGRGLGIFMFSVVLSPWTAGADKDTLAKIYLIPNLVFTLLFVQASFFMAETLLKYFYLLFQDKPQSVLDLDAFVLNTEAHPVRVFDLEEVEDDL